MNLALEHLTAVQGIVATAATWIAATSDLRTRRIPNVLTGPLVLSGLVWAGISGGRGGIEDAALGLTVCAVPFVILFVLGGGAGDAKLMAGVGAWLAWPWATAALVLVAVAGALIGIATAIERRRVLALTGSVNAMASSWMLGAMGYRGAVLDGSVGQKLTIPYGLAIAVGTTAAAIWGILS